MAAAPPRYLVACLGSPDPASRALLRFPHGVTLEDAGLQYALFPVLFPTLSPDAIGRLHGLGVEVVATGREAVSEALQRAGAGSREADVGAFAEDYLDANARLGGERCVSVREYAMDTYVGDKPLRRVLLDRLLQMRGVRVYGDAAFREGGLPDILRLRVDDITREMYHHAPTSMPCLLHHRWCSVHCDRNVGNAIYARLGGRHLGARVAVPRRLLDGLRDGDGRQAAQALLGVVGCVFDALPRDAWDWSDGRLSHALASIVALAVAETCEEHAMLTVALRECGSLGEMERRVRDRSWAVSRTLERLQDRW